ncbi:MAG: sialate O-acetylesterase [Planctomycetales bacterium]|nr:sialate O-acetylesterase [Planctomycetales bacterium]
MKTHHRLHQRLLTWLGAFALLFPAALQAELTVPTIFSDHMVLQRDQELPVWGWDTAGAEVTVSIDGKQQKAKAGDDGKWMVKLPAMKAGGPHELVVEGSSRKAFKDVLVGEVWICSGQSNMEWTVSRSNNSAEEAKNGDHPQIRHIKFGHRPSEKPATDVPSNGWEVCTPETVPNFTAVGYFFGRRLQQELNVPIGLIGSNWGGTRIEPWTAPEGFKSNPNLKSISDKLDSFPEKNNKGAINHQSALALYNGMIHPMVPFGVRGAIWYQGESNNGEGMLYYEKMKALIQGWRTIWNNDDMPFYFVQLAPFTYGGDPTRLAGIWEAQTRTLRDVPHTGMAVTVDIANLKDIHPKNKQDVGARLALWALAQDYGKKDLVVSGPLYRSMKKEGSKIRLTFDHVGGGLVSRDGEPLSWFTIAGKDGNFVEAKATIDGDNVVVECDAVPSPEHVRFGWSQLAEPNLSNKEGLPASPFRTDSK